MSRTTKPSSAGRFLNWSIAFSASATSPSASRFSSVSAKIPLPQAKTRTSRRVQIIHSFPHHRYGSRRGRHAGPSPARHIARCPVLDAKTPLSQPSVAQLRDQLEPALTICRGGPMHQRYPQREAWPSSVRYRRSIPRRCAPPPRSRAPRSHRPAAPRRRSRDRTCRRRPAVWVAGSLFRAIATASSSPSATRDGPATTERRRDTPTPPPAAIRKRSWRPWWGRRRPDR